MSTDRDACHALRRLALAVAAVTVLAATGFPARAEDDTNLDLKPADFVPEEPIAIRVDDLKPGKQGSDVAVTILNRTERDVVAVVECTLYDGDREDLGVATGKAVTVAAGERRATTVTGAEAAKFAECRVANPE